ncbi:MAG: hypothetical protein GC164_01770 [Phycisphaera sp.]|nr:hypothetical protein [Phycisphaera sp.]
MQRFAYQARDSAGQLATGVLNAPTLEEAGRILRGEGKFIVKLDPTTEAAQGDDLLTVEQHARRVKRNDVIIFANQLAVMIETGVPISEALDCITQQFANEHFRAVLKDITGQVQGGVELSTAMRKFPRVFPTVMISLIRASEISGTMGQMLERVSNYLNNEQQTRKKIKGALSYPIFMFVMATGVTIFLLGFVLPKFAAIYSQRNAALPAPTQLLMSISSGLTTYWYLWLALAVGIALTVVFGGRTEQGKRVFDYLKLNVPVFKQLFTQLYVSRAARTMSTMLNAGVSMLDMVSIVREVTNNKYYEDLWDEVDERLRQGSQLSDPLFQSPLIPRSISQMILSGEKSGRLGKTLERVATFTEQEFDTAVKTATQFIEPVMVGAMGLLVGFVAISLLLPIFSVGKVVAGG